MSGSAAPRPLLLLATIFQRPKPEPFSGDSAQLVFHRLEAGEGRVSVLLEFQPDRVNGREPTDRATEIRGAKNLFATVPLEIEAQVTTSDCAVKG